jgi:HD-GYP domain-containing protein (c-di-GMP phosphodiesterase class II)
MRAKRIPIDQLTPGMYLAGLDRPWLETPFFRHHFPIETAEDIVRLRQAGVREVTIDPSRGLDAANQPEVNDPGPESPSPPGPSDEHPPWASPQDIEAARAVRDRTSKALARLFDGVKTGVRLDVGEVGQAVEDVATELVRHRTAMMLLAQMSQMERSDRDPCAHALDVGVLSLVVGMTHGLDAPTVKQLGLGAVLHDVGELRLPQNLFKRSGLYTDDERRLIRRHPEIGASLLKNEADVPETSLRIVAEHHERLDGSGYPAGLRGDQIALTSQIVGLINVYDAMVSRRSYRSPLTSRQAIARLYEHERRTHFARALVERLIQCVGVYPLGTVVELNTGERGVVVAVNPEARLKPAIKVLTDPNGQSYPAPWNIDLSALAPTAPLRTITRVLDDLHSDWHDQFI